MTSGAADGSDERGAATLILGATGGIGSAVARLLVDRGQSVVLAARHGEDLVALAGELNEAAGRSVTDWRVLDAIDVPPALRSGP